MGTPMIDRVLSHRVPEEALGWLLYHERQVFLDEVRALLAERDALALSSSKWEKMVALYRDEVLELRERLKAEAPAPRPPRSYKGVEYREGKWCNEFADIRYGNVFVALAEFFEEPTDADHAALMQLKTDAEREPQTLEEVVREWCCTTVGVDVSYVSERELCEAIRAWLAQQPQERVSVAHKLPSSAYPLIQQALDYTVQGIRGEAHWLGTRHVCSDLVEKINAALASEATP